MSPEIKLSRNAQARFATIPLSLLDEVERQFVQLAEHPATLSEPSAFPFAPGLLMNHFRVTDFENTRWDFTILFHRLPDEIGIFIDKLVIQTQTEEERQGPGAL